MLETIAASVVVLMFAVAAMAVGVIAGRRSLQGSCGGIPGSACKCSKQRREACEQQHASAQPGPPEARLVNIPRPHSQN